MAYSSHLRRWQRSYQTSGSDTCARLRITPLAMGKQNAWWEPLKVIMKRSATPDVDEFLYNYRIVPHSVTGISPAELLLKRRLRNPLDFLQPTLQDSAKPSNTAHQLTFQPGARTRIKSGYQQLQSEMTFVCRSQLNRWYRQLNRWHLQRLRGGHRNHHQSNQNLRTDRCGNR